MKPQVLASDKMKLKVHGSVRARLRVKNKGLRFIVLYHVSTFHTTLQFTSYPP